MLDDKDRATRPLSVTSRSPGNGGLWPKIVLALLALLIIAGLTLGPMVLVHLMGRAHNAKLSPTAPASQR